MKRSILVVLMFLLASAWQLSTPQPVIKSEVSAVVVNALVVDQSDHPIPGLKKEDFRIFEDKVEQQIQTFFPVDAPFSVVLLLDTSYSTYGKLAPIQNAAIQFIDQIHPDDEVAVISFDDEVYLETGFTRNKEAARRAVKQTRTGQSTSLYEAVYLGLEQIHSQPHRKVAVLFSDGVDSSSRTHARETIRLAREGEVTIYTIWFDTRMDQYRPRPPFIGTPGTVPGRNPVPIGNPLPIPSPYPGSTGPSRRQMEAEYQRGRSYLDRLSEVSGGRRFDAADNLHNLATIFANIAEEMRSLYSLSYVSTNGKKDGKFRKINLKVDLAGAKVRARKGYVGPTSD